MDQTETTPAKQSQPDREPDEMDITIPKPAFEALNTMGSVFDADKSKRFNGINGHPSVFDKGTVFKTDTET